MQQIDKATISLLSRVRHQLASLEPDDTESLIQIGSELEAALGNISEDAVDVSETLILCLHALQAIFEGRAANFTAFKTILAATMAALEQSIASPGNAIASGMLQHTVGTLRSEIAKADGSGDTERPLLSEPTTIGEVAEALISVDPQNVAELTIIRDALKKISGSEDSVDIRKLMVKAAREIDRMAKGKSDNVDQSFDSVVQLIDKAQSLGSPDGHSIPDTTPLVEIETEVSIDIEISETVEIATPVVEPEPEPIVAKPTATPVPAPKLEPVPVRSYEPDQLAADSDLSLVSEFVIESSEMLEAAETALLALESDLEDLENVNIVFRAFHTIKGTAAYLGLARLAELAHLAESLLSRMRDREIQCTGGYADLALRSLDMLKAMLAGVSGCPVLVSMDLPDGYGGLIQILTNPEANGVGSGSFWSADNGPSEESDTSELSDDVDYYRTLGEYLVDNGKISINQLTDALDRQGTRLLGEVLIEEGLITFEDLVLARSEQIIKESERGAIGKYLIEAGKINNDQLAEALEKKGPMLVGEVLVNDGAVTLDDVTDARAKQIGNQNRKAATADLSVRVRTDRLDRLIDIVGELVIAQSMLAQDATVMQGIHHELSRKISHAGKIVRELQDLSMGMRMIPLRSTFQKLTRLVRDLGQKCGKQIEFITEGEDTEIDRNMVDLIADPLVHMVRNAVDHGIEKPDKREAVGKSRVGKIMLAAYHAGGDVVVELRDDGAGIDPDVIVAKAIEKNLIESEKGLSEDQIFNLILAPGFSTAEKVTDVSGRGVGMDVVRRNIEGMRGRISIGSEKAKGSTFTIRLPLTLAITDGMLIRVGVERFIIPIVNIQLSFQPNRDMLSRVAGRGELVSLRGELMPVFRLHRLFSVKTNVIDPTDGLLMIVADGRKRCALLVDELLGQQQVVAKNLGQGMGKIPGVSGGAILGDGCIGLILDTPEIVALARQNSGADVDEMEYQLLAA